MQNQSNKKYRMQQHSLIAFVTACAATIASPSYGAEFGSVTANSLVTFDDGRTVTDTFNFSSENAFSNALDTQVINNPIYDSGSPRPNVVVTTDIQGNDIIISTASHSNLIRLTSKSLGLNESYEGATRAESVRLLEKWAKDNAGRLLQKTNAVSGLSTVGGTSGYVPRTSVLDAGIDGTGVDANVLQEIAGVERSSHLSVLTGFANYDSKGRSAQVYSLPISYTWELDHGWAMLFNVPLTYIDTDGLASYSASLGTGVRIPMSNYINTGKAKWDLIPLFRMGAIGSNQNESETSLIYSGGLQSNLGVPLGNNYSLVFHNQYNHYTVTSITNYVDVKVNGNLLDIPDISNDIFRNGVQLVKDFDYKIFGRTLTTSISFADTRLTGDTLAINNQQEIGFDIGLRALTKTEPKFSIAETADDILQANTGKIKKKIKERVDASDIRVGFTYTRADGIDNAFAVNAGWTF